MARATRARARERCKRDGACADTAAPPLRQEDQVRADGGRRARLAHCAHLFSGEIDVELQAPIFGQDDARQVVAGQVVNLESTLRTTLRALAVCAGRGGDAGTVDQLVARARSLSEQLGVAIDSMDDTAASRDARAIAAHLAERLEILERVAAGASNIVYS